MYTFFQQQYEKNCRRLFLGCFKSFWGLQILDRESASGPPMFRSLDFRFNLFVFSNQLASVPYRFRLNPWLQWPLMLNDGLVPTLIISLPLNVQNFFFLIHLSNCGNNCQIRNITVICDISSKAKSQTSFSILSK